VKGSLLKPVFGVAEQANAGRLVACRDKNFDADPDGLSLPPTIAARPKTRLFWNT
jgi:hypothetical protein